MMGDLLHPDLLIFLAISAFPISLFISARGTQTRERGYREIFWGTVVGLAVVVLIELLNSSIRRPVDLTNGLGIMPLGTIPMIRTRGEVIRRRLIILAGFVIALGVVPWALWYVHTRITPLDALINQILSRLPI